MHVRSLLLFRRSASVIWRTVLKKNEVVKESQSIPSGLTDTYALRSAKSAWIGVKGQNLIENVERVQRNSMGSQSRVGHSGHESFIHLHVVSNNGRNQVHATLVFGLK